MKSYRVLYRVEEMIYDPTLLRISRLKVTAFTRKRVGGMGFSDALRFMPDMGKTTLQTRLNAFYRQVKGANAISQSAFTQLRANFSHKPFEHMLRELVREEYSGKEPLPPWKGYLIFSVDGSYLQLPWEPELAEKFGVRGGGNRPSAGISVLFDVLNGWVLDAEIDRTDRNERHALGRHMDFLAAKLPEAAKRSILLADRGYPSYELLQKCEENGQRFVMRCSSHSIKATTEAPMGDSTATLENGQRLRIVKFVLNSGEVETLATNLFDLPESDFPALYAMRWGVETMYHELKRVIGVEKFSGKTVNSVRQDFWTSLLLLNVAATFQKEADQEVAKRHEGKPVKHIYHTRTTDLIITLRDRLIFARLCGHLSLAQWETDNIFGELSRAISPVRPHRHFPRVKRPFANARQNLKSVL